MTFLERIQGAPTSQRPLDRTSLRTQRMLTQVTEQGMVRQAGIITEGDVQATKLHVIDDLSREAMTGHTMLVRWRETLSAGDPLLLDELKFFSDIARVGKGEIIADTIETFCRESRR